MSDAEEFLLFIFNKCFMPSMWEKVGGDDQKAGWLWKSVIGWFPRFVPFSFPFSLALTQSLCRELFAASVTAFYTICLHCEHEVRCVCVCACVCPYTYAAAHETSPHGCCSVVVLSPAFGCAPAVVVSLLYPRCVHPVDGSCVADNPGDNS